MNRNLFDPPGIVRSVDVRAELAPKIKATYRRTKEDRKQLKEWLFQYKAACEAAGDPWTVCLERETGMSRSSAWDIMNLDENSGQEKGKMSESGHYPQKESLESGESEDEEDEEFLPDTLRQLEFEAAENGDYEQAREYQEERAALEERQSLPLSGEDNADYITLEAWNRLPSAMRKKVIEEASGDKKFNSQGDNENIEWALWSWNPVTGCLHNCPYCYARDIATTGPTAHAFPNGFAPTLIPSRLKAPHNTTFPESKAREWMGHKNVFVCSMADLFGRWVPAEWIEAVLAEVRAAPQWNFLFLTKFPIRMAEFAFPDNAWVGTTVDCQARVQNAEKAFRQVKAGVKWLSVEPMIEPLHFADLGAFQWIVIGGSSRSSQTPEWHPPRKWFWEIEKEAKKLGVPFYEKANLHGRLRGYPGQPIFAEPESAPEELHYLPRDR
jgi:protein gp37